MQLIRTSVMIVTATYLKVSHGNAAVFTADRRLVEFCKGKRLFKTDVDRGWDGRSNIIVCPEGPDLMIETDGTIMEYLNQFGTPSENMRGLGNVVEIWSGHPVMYEPSAAGVAAQRAVPVISRDIRLQRFSPRIAYNGAVADAVVVADNVALIGGGAFPAASDIYFVTVSAAGRRAIRFNFYDPDGMGGWTLMNTAHVAFGDISGLNQTSTIIINNSVMNYSHLSIIGPIGGCTFCAMEGHLEN